jgi:hypothetical protein
MNLVNISRVLADHIYMHSITRIEDWMIKSLIEV